MSERRDIFLLFIASHSYSVTQDTQWLNATITERPHVGPNTDPGSNHHWVQDRLYQSPNFPGSAAQIRPLHFTPRNINSDHEISWDVSSPWATGTGKNWDGSAESGEPHQPELGGVCSSGRAHHAVEWHNPLAEAGNRYSKFLSTGSLWHRANGGLRGAPAVSAWDASGSRVQVFDS